MTSNDKPLGDWSHEEVLSWLQGIKQIPPNPKQAIKEKLVELETDGSFLTSCSNADELMEMLDFQKEVYAKLLWTQLLKIQPEGGISQKPVPSPSNRTETHQPSPGAIATQQNKVKKAEESLLKLSINSNNNNSSLENINFRPTIYMNGKTTTKEYYINSSWTVTKLRETLQDKETGVSSDAMTKDKFVMIDLVVGNTQLSDGNKPLHYYGLVNSYKTILVVSRLKGGTQLSNNSADYIRKVDINNPLITTTKDPDCITYEDGDDDPRAKMPCGHAFTAITMYTFIRHSFNSDLEITEFFCPFPNCGYKKPWEWSLMAAVANLTMDEFNTYSNLLNEHLAIKNEIKLCPHCKTMINKPDQISQTRVHCTNCNGSDFCYSCSKLWIGGGLQICGNKTCDTNFITETLATCEIIKIGEKIQIPSIRACPNCLTLLRHVQNCKHMKCARKDCGIEFCFSCLIRKDPQKGWQCSGAYDHCTAAGRQIIK